MHFRNKYLTVLIIFLFAGTLSSTLAGPPNIVFVLIDDLGWMDLACQGNPLVETPRVDQLAKEGMRFTAAYSAAPVCSPSRAAILTGKSPARLQITNHTPDRPSFTPQDAKLKPAAMLNHLPSEHVTIAERLAEVGYLAGFFGKWHLSGPGAGDKQFDPLAQGFDVNVGGCGFGGPPSFFDPYKNPTIPNRKAGEYLPDRLADEAIQFMSASANHQRDKTAPFLLFLWNYTVHWPMEAPQHLLEKYKDRKGPGLNDTRYGAMIEAMDSATGRVLDAIDMMGIRDETLVVFTSDNGAFGGVGDNRPLRRDKGHLYEGGIRVPLIVRWPGKVKTGSECDEPVIGTDFYATLLEAAGLKLNAASDGMSLMPLFEGQQNLDREAIYFHYPNYAFHKSNRLGAAVRTRQYKLIHHFDDDSIELFDLTKDLSEKHDLSATMPQRAQELKADLATWLKTNHAEMPTPISHGPLEPK